jgi:O-antigen/teichoic acid export membrane protein
MSASGSLSDAPAPPAAEINPRVRPARVSLVVRARDWLSLIPQGILSLVDQGLVSATGFATSVLIGRLCDPRELGVYYLALSIVLFIRGIQEQIISTPYMIFNHRRLGAARDAYLGSCFAHQAMTAGFTVLGLAGLGTALSLGVGPPTLLPAVYVLLGAAPALLLREFLRQMSFAHLRLHAVLLLDASVAALQLGGLAIFAWRGWISPSAALAAMGGASAVACMTWFFTERPRMHFAQEHIVADWRRNWAFSRWTLAGQVMGTAVPFVLPWLLAHWHGASATGTLAACSTLVGVGNMFLTGVSNYLTPKAAKAYVHEGIPGLQRVLKLAGGACLVVLGGFTLLIAVAGEWLVRLAFDGKYEHVGVVMTVLALSTLVNSLSVTASNGLYALEQVRANFRVDVCVTIVSLFAAALVLPLGVLGAALATFSGTVTGAIVRILIVHYAMASHEPQKS